MRKQINQKPSYKYGEKIRTKNILRRLRLKGNPNEYLRMKYFLKLANAMGNADLGYVSYAKTLDIVENAKDNLVLSLKDGFGYPLEGETVDKLTERDLGLLVFKVPLMAFIKINTREIQKIISAIPEYQLQRASSSLGCL
jgi:hypothetical protein